jgi:hypothetical protein
MNHPKAERRARRLLHWYPERWRARYGDEFTQLLIDDINDQPHSWRRTLNTAHRGLATRLPRERPRRTLATTLGLLAIIAFLAVDRPWASMSSAQAARALEQRLSSPSGARALGLAHAITDRYACSHTAGQAPPGEPAWTFLCRDAVHNRESGFFVRTRGDGIAEISPAG